MKFAYTRSDVRYIPVPMTSFSSSIVLTEDRPELYLPEPRDLRDREELDPPDRYSDESMVVLNKLTADAFYEEYVPKTHLDRHFVETDFSFTSLDRNCWSAAEHALYSVRRVAEEFERNAKERFRKHYTWKKGIIVKLVHNNKDPFTDNVGVVFSFSRKMVQIKLEEGSVISRSKNKVVRIGWP